MGRTGCKEKDMHLSLRDTFVTGRNGRVTHVHLGDGYTYLLVSPLLFPRESTIPGCCYVDHSNLKRAST